MAPLSVQANGDGRLLNTGLSYEGYSGLLTVPEARVVPEGTLDLHVNNFLEPGYRTLPDREARNYNVTFGPWPYLELGGRLAEIHPEGAPTYEYGALDLRDLSGHAKLQVPHLLPEASYWPRFAVGMQDFGGLAVNFETRYAVATSRAGPFQASVGYGTGPDRLEGAFGGLTLQPVSWAQVMLERTPRNTRAGGRLVWQDFWKGMDLSGKATLWEKEQARTSFGVTLSIPLGQGTEPSGVEKAGVPDGLTKPQPQEGQQSAPAGAEIEGEGEQGDPSETSQPVSLPDEWTPALKGDGGARSTESIQAIYPGYKPLEGMADALEDAGLSDVRVGRQGEDQLVVAVAAPRFRHSFVDGLGIALGVASVHAPDRYKHVRVVLERKGQPSLWVEAPVAEYRRYLSGGISQSRLRGDLVSGFPDPWAPYARVDWVYTKGKPAPWGRLVLSPEVRSLVGHERGAFVYSTAITAHPQVNLWPGGQITAAYRWPMVHSPPYEEGGYWSDSRIRGGLGEVLFQQALSLAPGLTTQTSVGRYEHMGDAFLGGVEEVHYNLGSEGNHSIRLFGGHFENRQDDKPIRQIGLGGYQYYKPEWTTGFSVMGGEFFYGDKGVRASIRRDFHDFSLRFFVNHTIADAPLGAGYGDAAGLQVSFPITPRKEPRVGPIVFGGPKRWHYYLRTTIDTHDGRNVINPRLQTQIRPFYGMRKAIQDHGRLSPGFAKANLPRMRAVYYQYADDEAAERRLQKGGESGDDEG